MSDTKQVPLTERLRAIPITARAVVQDTFSVSYYPAGSMCHEAATSIEVEQHSRAMFVARLRNGDQSKLLNVSEVLALMDDCDMLAQRSIL